MFEVDVDCRTVCELRRYEAVFPSSVSAAILEKLSEQRSRHQHHEKESEQPARTPEG